jgi:hypothetical protein
MGIGGSGVPEEAETDHAGQLSLHARRDVGAVVEGLAAASADIRILSLHYGTEMMQRPSADQVRRWRTDFSRAGNIDIIAGHHAHVAQGIEIVDGRLILYGLGNFLHQGLSDLTGKGHCRDWGLLVRVHLLVRGDSPPAIAALEAVPLTAMHVQTRPLDAPSATRRIAVLNGLAAQFDAPAQNARGVRFLPQADGSGLFCALPAATLPPALADRCTAYEAMAAALPVVTCSGSHQTLARNASREGQAGTAKRKGKGQKTVVPTAISRRQR